MGQSWSNRRTDRNAVYGNPSSNAVKGKDADTISYNPADTNNPTADQDHFPTNSPQRRPSSYSVNTFLVDDEAEMDLETQGVKDSSL